MLQEESRLTRFAGLYRGLRTTSMTFSDGTGVPFFKAGWYSQDLAARSSWRS